MINCKMNPNRTPGEDVIKQAVAILGDVVDVSSNLLKSSKASKVKDRLTNNLIVLGAMFGSKVEGLDLKDMPLSKVLESYKTKMDTYKSTDTVIGGLDMITQALFNSNYKDFLKTNDKKSVEAFTEFSESIIKTVTTMKNDPSYIVALETEVLKKYSLHGEDVSTIFKHAREEDTIARAETKGISIANRIGTLNRKVEVASLKGFIKEENPVVEEFYSKTHGIINAYEQEAKEIKFAMKRFFNQTYKKNNPFNLKGDQIENALSLFSGTKQTGNYYFAKSYLDELKRSGKDIPEQEFIRYFENLKDEVSGTFLLREDGEGLQQITKKFIDEMKPLLLTGNRDPGSLLKGEQDFIKINTDRILAEDWMPVKKTKEIDDDEPMFSAAFSAKTKKGKFVSGINGMLIKPNVQDYNRMIHGNIVSAIEDDINGLSTAVANMFEYSQAPILKNILDSNPEWEKAHRNSAWLLRKQADDAEYWVRTKHLDKPDPSKGVRFVKKIVLYLIGNFAAKKLIFSTGANIVGIATQMFGEKGIGGIVPDFGVYQKHLKSKKNTVSKLVADLTRDMVKSRHIEGLKKEEVDQFRQGTNDIEFENKAIDIGAKFIELVVAADTKITNTVATEGFAAPITLPYKLTKHILGYTVDWSKENLTSFNKSEVLGRSMKSPLAFKFLNAMVSSELELKYGKTKMDDPSFAKKHKDEIKDIFNSYEDAVMPYVSKTVDLAAGRFGPEDKPSWFHMAIKNATTYGEIAKGASLALTGFFTQVGVHALGLSVKSAMRLTTGSSYVRAGRGEGLAQLLWDLLLWGTNAEIIDNQLGDNLHLPVLDSFTKKMGTFVNKYNPLDYGATSLVGAISAVKLLGNMEMSDKEYDDAVRNCTSTVGIFTGTGSMGFDRQVFRGFYGEDKGNWGKIINDNITGLSEYKKGRDLWRLGASAINDDNPGNYGKRNRKIATILNKGESIFQFNSGNDILYDGLRLSMLLLYAGKEGTNIQEQMRDFEIKKQIGRRLDATLSTYVKDDNFYTGLFMEMLNYSKDKTELADKKLDNYLEDRDLYYKSRGFFGY